MVFWVTTSFLKSLGLFSVFWPISAYAVVSMVSTRSVISKFSSPFTQSLLTVPRASISIDITITFMFHIFFNFQTRLGYRSFFSPSFNFTLWSARTAKSTIRQGLFFSFLLIIIKSGRLVEIRWSVCVSKSQRSLCISFSRTDSWLCIYHLFVWSSLHFLHSSQWTDLPT